MANPTYDINYEDERFAQVEADKNNALTELEETYSGMIENSDKYYDNLIQSSKDWADQQSQLQQEKTDFTIEQINQQKDKAEKDYIKEQSGAYVDWQKQSNQYGSEAEKMASAGLTNTGFSESSQVSMYNTYQNRVATARESFNNAVLNYNNSIKDAQLQNNSILAEIAYNSLQQQLELSLQGFQYKNNLILEQASKKTELNNTYYNRYLDVLNQINTENAMAEDVRQFNETLAFNANQAELDREHQSTENELNRNFQAAQAELDRNFQAQQAELERQHDMAMLEAQTKAEKELLNKQHAQAMAKLEKQHEYELEMLEKEYALAKKSAGITGNSGNKTSSAIAKTESDVKNATQTGIKSNTSSPSTNLMDLGLGPITEDYAAKLVAAGLITATKSNGKIYYQNTSGATRQNVDALLKLAGY